MQTPAELVLREQSPFNFCVIDEVDSILIDEARTPLIISGTSDKPSDRCGGGNPSPAVHAPLIELCDMTKRFCYCICLSAYYATCNTAYQCAM